VSVGVERHILHELGFGFRRVGDEMRGSAEITPEMHVPGTTRLRTSVLFTWADHLAGNLAKEALPGRVPVTLGLDIHLHRPAPAAGVVHGIGRTIKAGRTVFVGGIDFFSAIGEPIAVVTTSFMAAPDTSLPAPAVLGAEGFVADERLAVPFAERAGCARTGPGTAVLHRSEDGLNPANSVNGGLVALVAEEAVLAAVPGATVASLSLSYLQAVRVGPVLATAVMSGGLGRVEVRDQGNGDRLCVAATARTM
jgi:acyl-coenzyme A thioesterase PaaI-like protein